MSTVQIKILENNNHYFQTTIYDIDPSEVHAIIMGAIKDKAINSLVKPPTKTEFKGKSHEWIVKI
jgi:hypothetical protein